MTITLRGTKGVELTHAELDGNFTDLDTRVSALAGSLDSAKTLALIDSNYIKGQADSNYIKDLVDSNYISQYAATGTMYKYFYEADSGDRVFTDSDIRGNVLLFDSSNIMVYKNGILLHEVYDFTMTNKNTITLTLSMDSGHDLIITTWM